MKFYGLQSFANLSRLAIFVLTRVCHRSLSDFHRQSIALLRYTEFAVQPLIRASSIGCSQCHKCDARVSNCSRRRTMHSMIWMPISIFFSWLKRCRR